MNRNAGSGDLKIGNREWQASTETAQGGNSEDQASSAIGVALLVYWAMQPGRRPEEWLSRAAGRGLGWR